MTAINSQMSSGIPMVESDTMKTVGKSSLDRADFMTLFITQLQYQDPMKPMDSYEMASQLAQFSSMEATMKVSDNMEKLLEYQMSQNNLQLLGLIGKEVETTGNEIGVTEGKSAVPSFTLADSAAFCVVYIYDSAGTLTRTMDLGYRNSGSQTLNWDGKDNSGNQVIDGRYTYQVEALSATGEEVGAELRTSGRVTGVEFDSGAATVTVGGYIQKRVSEIIKVNDRLTAQEPQAAAAPQDQAADDPPFSESGELPEDDEEQG